MKPPTGEFDVIVLGAGPVGENVADYAHQGGLSVALVESDLVGGTCSYWACMPSKALLQPIHALNAATRVAGAKEAVAGPVDVAALLSRRDSFVSHYDDSGQVAWVDSAGITLIRGHGRLDGPRQVRVSGGSHDGSSGDRVLHARRAVVVCTGSVPTMPNTPGLPQARPWTSNDATGMPLVPKRLAIIGGGVVACEMATAAAGLGSSVTVIVRGKGLLERMEPFAGRLVLESLRASGVDVRLSATAQHVARAEGDGAPVTITLDGGDVVEADELLVSTGRRANTDDIGLDSIGLEPGKPLRTSNGQLVATGDDEWLFAAGDVTGEVLLTHQGKYQARLLGDRLAAEARGERPDLEPWGRHAPTADVRAVPQVVFTDPEVAMVGLTAADAAKRGLRVRQVEYDIGHVAGAALVADGYTGRASMLVDLDSETLVGATFVGQQVAELLHSATIAVVGEVPLARLWHAVPSYPTISEVWLRLMEAYRQG